MVQPGQCVGIRGPRPAANPHGRDSIGLAGRTYTERGRRDLETGGLRPIVLSFSPLVRFSPQRQVAHMGGEQWASGFER